MNYNRMLRSVYKISTGALVSTGTISGAYGAYYGYNHSKTYRGFIGGAFLGACAGIGIGVISEEASIVFISIAGAGIIAPALEKAVMKIKM